VDGNAVRFFYREQFFRAIAVFSLDLCMLPSHLYNLADPDNPDHDPNASPEKQGDYINDNPHNIDWVGLGPYQLTTWERGRFLEAKKFDRFWNQDPAYAGYMDTFRWTHVDDDNLALQALLNHEVDIFDRVKSEDFLGAATMQEVFTNDFYKAYTYTGNIGYTGWNTYKPHLSDVRVRTALAHAFDVNEWIRTNYEGLALPATGTQFWFGPGYNRDVEMYPCDPQKAQELLAEAGWYDRDGNGIVDKDGQDLVIEALMPSGNKASEKFLQKLQESFEKVGVRLTITSLEWAQFLERILDRDFDACNLAWSLTDVESDPFSLWHSSEAAPDRRTSNHSGLRDDEVDRLIVAIRRELDDEKRHDLLMQLHARVYELQPYLFGWNIPRKIAFNKKLHGVKLYKFNPGYRLRDMYYGEGTPGTRPIGSSS
jgi:peptide/nickel transport system substrate-binding protein